MWLVLYHESVDMQHRLLLILSLSLWSLLMYVLAHRYATLYMNPDTMEVSDIMFIRHAVSAVGKLCPDQRRVPQLVSFFVVVVVLY